MGYINSQTVDSTIEFILNGEVIRLNNPNPQMSVLTYCRESVLKTGTHEGCAEGDCGACTVVIAELNIANELVYKNINACILLLPMLHGKALFTVESLKRSEKLHPVQQSMIDHHASQCGFCTPGFVMSLFALYQSGVRANRDNISASLSGNLCRCTGYKPIIDAAMHMHDYEVDESFDAENEPLKKRLLLMKNSTQKNLTVDHLSSFIPTSINELCVLKAQYPQAVVIAGNTDVGLWLNKQLKDIPILIHLTQIDALKKIECHDDALILGAAVSVFDAFALLVSHFPSLADAARRFASQPICHAATLVGNLANGSPIGDSAPILMALGAHVKVRSLKGSRDILLDDFYLGYQQKDLKDDEFIESVSIPLKANKNKQIAYYKISKRFDQDISAMTMAIVLSIDNDNHVETCKIVCGGMAATTARAFKTEAVLIGESWQQQRVNLAKRFLDDDFHPLDDLRASAKYRQQLAKNLLQRFFIETTYPDVSVCVYDEVNSG